MKTAKNVTEFQFKLSQLQKAIKQKEMSDQRQRETEDINCHFRVELLVSQIRLKIK